MPQLIWTENALKDVQRLYRFLAVKNPDAAKRAVQAIRTQVKIIAEHPDIGKPVSDMPESYREWPIGFGNSGYIARYRLAGDNAVILAVWHQREAGQM